MLKFTCCFDVERDILNYVKKQRSDHAKRYFPEDKIHVKVVGQERELEVIYIWDDVSNLTPHKLPVTHVGLYTPSTQTHSTIFVHDKQLNIVSCSVNQAHSVLAYVALVKYSKRLQTPRKSTRTELYSAYLAEIKPQNRIFDLNIQRRNQLQVQFLWSSPTHNKECKMIFFLHQESIALYNIPLGRVDQLGVVISSQPTVSEIVKHFYWSHWDLSSQRLFFVSRKYSKSVEVQPYLVLKCYEYNCKNNNFIKMLEIKLDFPIPEECTPQEYPVSGPSRTVAYKQFNMEVIQQSGGSLCVCYQHPLKKAIQTRPRSVTGFPSVMLDNPTMSAPEDDTDADLRLQAGPFVRSMSFDERSGSCRELVDLKYSIIVVHHGIMINATIPSMTRNIAENTQLYFSSVDGYVLVYSPGLVSHLVNVNPDINPCLHIALNENTISDMINRGSSEAFSSHNLTHFVRERTASLNGDCMFNNQSGQGFKVSISKEGLVETFKEQTRPTQRLAIIHYLMLHMKDPAVTKQVMKVVCDDMDSPYIPQLFSEYLIGSTFNAVRRSMNKDSLKHLAFTSTDVLRGQIEQNCGGRISVVFSYTKCPAVFDAFFYKADRKERRQSQISVNIGVWESVHQLVQSLHKSRQKQQQQRFNTSTLKAALVHDETTSSKLERSKSVTDTPASSRSSFVQKMKLSAKNALSPTMRRRAGSTSIFYASEALANETDKNSTKLQQLMIDKLTRHFEYHLTSYNKKVNMRSLAMEYIGCQMKQSTQLLELLCTSVGLDDQLKPADISLLTAVSEQERHLYNLLERYYLAIDSVCFPFPPGFQTYFTCLGYRCLTYMSFLQYVERGVLQLTPEFVRKFFKELPDDELNSTRKHDILAHLSQPEALEVLEGWKHPFALRYLAQQYVEETLKSDCCAEYPYYLNRETAIEQDTGQARVGSTYVSSDDEQEGITAAFPPLGTLLKLLQEKDQKVIVVNHGLDNQPSCFQMEPRKVEQVALLNTMEKYGNNLSDVTF